MSNLIIVQFPSLYDLYSPNKVGIDFKNRFYLSEEEIRLELQAEWLPLFCRYMNNIEFEINNQKFTNSKFLSETYTKCLFVDCEFENVTFTNQILTNCTFENCIFKNSSFSSVKINNNSFQNCQFIQVTFTKTNIKESQFNECQFFDIFWDASDIINSLFSESVFKENMTLGMICENVKFEQDFQCITISLDGKFNLNNFLNFITDYS